jgi:hypothetical protein
MSSPSQTTTHTASPSEAKPWVKPLVGHSGCGLTLHKHQETGHFFVRKTAASAAYNKRLQRQCSKQRRFLGRR